MSKNGLNLNMGLVMGLSGGGGKSKYLGPVDHLPILTASDEGTMAYDKGLKVPVYWDGNDWKSVIDGSTVTPNYLRFDSAGTSLIKTGHTGGGIDYSLDNGKTWHPMQKDVFIPFSTILLCGNITAMGSSFAFEGNAVDASGDVTSLVNGRGGDVELGVSAFAIAFFNCKELRTAPNCPSTTLGNRAYQSMFSGCTNIAAFRFATLNTSKNVFDDCSSATALTIDAVEPPTIDATTISGLKADCAILVPASAVAAYKAAQYWSDRADYIQAQP